MLTEYRWTNRYGVTTTHKVDLTNPVQSVIRWNRMFNPRYRYTLAHGVYRYWPLMWLRVRVQEVFDVASIPFRCWTRRARRIRVY